VQQAKLLQNGNVKCFVENSPKTTVANVNKKRWQLALVAPVNKTVPAADNFCCLLMLIFFFLFCRVTTNANCQGRSAERNICHVNMVQRKEKKKLCKKRNTFSSWPTVLTVQEQLNEKYLRMQQSICFKCL